MSYVIRAGFRAIGFAIQFNVLVALLLHVDARAIQTRGRYLESNSSRPPLAQPGPCVSSPCEPILPQREVRPAVARRPESPGGLLQVPHEILKLKAYLGPRLSTVLQSSRTPQPRQPLHKWSQPWMMREGSDGIGIGGLESSGPLDWIILWISVVCLLLLDMLVLRRVVPDTFGGHASLLLVWLGVAMIYACHIRFMRGSEDAEIWVFGYILECMLSLDNLFIFHLVFRVFKTPRSLRHKGLSIWFGTTAVLRTMFFILLSALLESSYWIVFIFGCLLIYSGFVALYETEEEDTDDVADHAAVRCLKRLLGDRLESRYDEENEGLFFWDGPKVRASMLLVVVVLLVVTDIMCALDSVSAKAAQIKDRYLACSSSIIALFLLRSFFWIIQDLIELCELLKYGICVILVYVGAQLICSRWFSVPMMPEMCFIVCVFLISIVLSFAKASLYSSNVSGATEAVLMDKVEQRAAEAAKTQA